MKDLEFVTRVLKIFDGFHGQSGENLSWRVDGEYAPVSFFAKCNDLFWWGSSDSEEVTPDNVHEMERALADCLAVNEECNKCRPITQRVYTNVHAETLFCCRMRKMRPQGAYYNHLPEEMWPLIDACGPARSIDVGNPTLHPYERKE